MREMDSRYSSHPVVLRPITPVRRQQVTRGAGGYPVLREARRLSSGRAGGIAFLLGPEGSGCL